MPPSLFKLYPNRLLNPGLELLLGVGAQARRVDLNCPNNVLIVVKLAQEESRAECTFPVALKP